MFNTLECKRSKEIILCITESDKETHQHKSHIWISMAGAKTLLERIENRFSIIDRKSVASHIKMPIAKFVDTERNGLVELKLVRNRIGDTGLKILLQSLVKNKEQAILVPLDGISNFQEKLSAMIRNYEKLKEPNRPKTFDDLCNASFFFEPMRYFLELYKSRVYAGILLGLSEYNKDRGKKRDIIIPIESAQTLFNLLKEAYEFIQSHEGRLSTEKQPLDVLYEKSFADQVEEYTVQVVISEPKMRLLGDMILNIKSQSRNNENIMNFIIIRSHGAHLLLEHFVKVLQEYYRLRPALFDTESTKPSGLTAEQRDQMLDQELGAWRTEVETALTDLEPTNWKGSEEDRQKEFFKRKEKFSKNLDEIYKKYRS